MGKILFIRGGAVGDFVLTMPAVHLVRERFPNNEIQVLGYPAIASLAVASGIADSVFFVSFAHALVEAVATKAVCLTWRRF